MTETDTPYYKYSPYPPTTTTTVGCDSPTAFPEGVFEVAKPVSPYRALMEKHKIGLRLAYVEKKRTGVRPCARFRFFKDGKEVGRPCLTAQVPFYDTEWDQLAGVGNYASGDFVSAFGPVIYGEMHNLLMTVPLPPSKG